MLKLQVIYFFNLFFFLFIFYLIQDFGISKKISEVQSNTKTMRVGTALYMAPEVILTNNYDQKCDIFSFAIIMFQCLTKKIENIYQQEQGKEDVSNIKNDKIIELIEINNNNN